MEPSAIIIENTHFFYRDAPRNSGVLCWPNPGNYGPVFIDTEIVAKAAEELKALTRRERIMVTAIMAPDHIDDCDDDHRIETFNKHVCDVLITLGFSRAKANEVFASVGMPSEWRGTMWRAASLAESMTPRDEDQRDLMQRLATICRFMPMAMTVDGPFKWVLAIGSRVLADALARHRKNG